MRDSLSWVGNRYNVVREHQCIRYIIIRFTIDKNNNNKTRQDSLFSVHISLKIEYTYMCRIHSRIRKSVVQLLFVTDASIDAYYMGWRDMSLTLVSQRVSRWVSESVSGYLSGWGIMLTCRDATYLKSSISSWSPLPLFRSTKRAELENDIFV